jgi:DNA-binding transcriptional MerR regulator
MDDYVAISVASERTGIPGRTLRYWAKNGKVAAISGSRGKLVRLDDVSRLAALVGKISGNEVGKQADEDLPDGKRVANLPQVAASARAQLDAVMAEWIAPLAARIEALARENGELAADLRTARVSQEAAEQERDALRSRLDALEASVRPVEPSAYEARYEPNASPGGVHEGSTASPRPCPSWWRRFLFGEV